MTSLLVKTKTVFRRLRRQDDGAVAIEYGLIAVLVGIALIPAITNYRTALSQTYEYVVSSITAVM